MVCGLVVQWSIRPQSMSYISVNQNMACLPWNDLLVVTVVEFICKVCANNGQIQFRKRCRLRLRIGSLADVIFKCLGYS